MLAFIRGMDIFINFCLLIVVIAVLAFAAYALWDSAQVHRDADKSHYEVYKPTNENKGKTFAELISINREVIAWLTVFNTNIDYPVTQTVDNMKYVNTNAEGRYSLSGAVFLDYRNPGDFSDFNNILYGHNMDKRTMFGEVGEFADSDFFDTNKYGNLYFNGRNHGIEFFAFVHTDAYNGNVFWPIVPEELRQEYLDCLMEDALQTRDIGVTTDDNLILLSTCSPNSTNGRDILIGRITDRVFLQSLTVFEDEPGFEMGELFARPIHLLPIVIKSLLAVMILTRARKRRLFEGGQYENKN